MAHVVRQTNREVIAFLGGRLEGRDGEINASHLARLLDQNPGNMRISLARMREYGLVAGRPGSGKVLTADGHRLADDVERRFAVLRRVFALGNNVETAARWAWPAATLPDEALGVVSTNRKQTT